jgi:tetratricopeptide (TPR) repeat protein
MRRLNGPVRGARYWAWLLLAAGLALAPGAGASSDQSPEQEAGLREAEDNFDAIWVTASSDHFLLYATGGARVARRALEEAERAVQALRLALTINGDFPDDHRRLTLVLFAYPGLYDVIAPPRTMGIFRPGFSWGETDLVLLRGAGRFQVLRHELVHRLMQPVLPKAPPWLSEGMAQYFQWTEAGESSIAAGSTAETARLQRALHDSPFFPPLPQLLATPKSSFYGQQAHGLYSASFWLVSTLNSDAGHRKRFNSVLLAMAKGTPFDNAWEHAFPQPELEALERDYRSSPSRSDPVAHVFAFQPRITAIEAPRPLNAAEVHVLLARLHGRGRPTIAREELDAAIESDPRHAEAFARRSLLDPGPSKQQRQDAERAVALDPSAPLGWQALGLALLPTPRQGDKTRLREVVDRLASFGDSAESQSLGAVLLEATGERKRALELARSSVRIAPASFYAHAVLSKLAPGGENGREAREARARAWALAPDGLDPNILVLLLGGSAPPFR